MDSASTFILTLGSILLLGLATDLLGKKTRLPRVTLLLLFGVLIGQEGLNLIPAVFTSNFDIIADMTLLMVGFLLGGKLTRAFLADLASEILVISIIAALVTTLVVGILLYTFDVPTEIAILLGCIASATAPAATVDIILENNMKGRFPDMLMSIVALDDVWGLIIFSFGLAAVGTINGHDSGTASLLAAFRDIGGAVFLGLLIGIPAAFFTGRIKSGQPLLTEAIGLVFFCGGLALWLEVSFVIASIVMGSAIANLASHHERSFHEIENIEWPFMSVFFVLAGALLEISALESVGTIGIIYIIARIAGKLGGSWLGAIASKSPRLTRKWIGPAMLPQAGVAIGMALVASSAYPEYSQLLLPVVISSTVFFEIIGPLASAYSLRKATVEETS